MEAEKKTLQCAEGYHFRKLGSNKVAMMKGNNTGATFSCECYDGGCKIEIDSDQRLSCVEDQCKSKEGCHWVVSVAGIQGGFIARM